jgi:hypothetical protein
MQISFTARLSFNCINCLGAKTVDDNAGSTLFTKLDFQNNIVSVIFGFAGTDSNTGTVPEITEGGLDAQFTQ